MHNNPRIDGFEVQAADASALPQYRLCSKYTAIRLFMAFKSTSKSLPQTLRGALGTYHTIPNPYSYFFFRVISPPSSIGRSSHDTHTHTGMLYYCRYMGSSGKAAHVIATPAHADPSSPESRLMQALPKQLLQQSEQQARPPNAGV